MLLHVRGACLVQYGAKINPIHDLYSYSADPHGSAAAEIPACPQRGNHWYFSGALSIYGVPVSMVLDKTFFFLKKNKAFFGLCISFAFSCQLNFCFANVAEGTIGW